MWTWCAGAATTIVVFVGCAQVAGAAPTNQLAWTQEGGAAGLRFRLFVDGVGSVLGNVSCVAGRGGSECSAVLPAMRAGVHTIALSAVDEFGKESARSQSVSMVIASSSGGHSTLTVVGSDRTSLPASAVAADAGSHAAAVPPRACAGQDCYGVSVLATGEGSISRIKGLGDDAALMLRDAGQVLLLRSQRVSVAYSLQQDDPGASAIADLAVDPDFANNRFVYLAVVSASSRVRVVRLRELADRLAEAATIVPDLQIARDVMPRLSMAADRRLYLAIPPAPAGAAAQSSDGVILAFTDDGRSAGAASGSPVLARGPRQPATLESNRGWLWAASLDDDADGRLGLLKLSADGVLTTTRDIESGTAQNSTGVLDLAFTGPDRGLLIAASPRSLFTFRLSADAAFLVKERIDIGEFEPMALSAMPSGSIVVAARAAGNSDAVLILSLAPLADTGR